MMTKLEKYYRVLELEPGASIEEVNQSYRDMVFVWHPDRFVNHPRLHQKAHAKIQEINEARDRLQFAVQKAPTTKAATKSSSRVSPASHSGSTVQHCYKQKVNPVWESNYKTVMDERVHVSYPNKIDACGWLD
ncbi:J domain-containing protein [Microseira sp. BLCC-F43]|jgi:curved DNA-binding protein CbpA|uniref:J domain-containing protein n=1 Tax=Microseira sp. BLCC-F43 TaxID=3153602 RepID=UPI0035B940FB